MSWPNVFLGTIRSTYVTKRLTVALSGGNALPFEMHFLLYRVALQLVNTNAGMG